jgi:hypothetical protein
LQEPRLEAETTRAPLRASRNAVEAPIPLLPPVTKQTLPWRSIDPREVRSKRLLSPITDIAKNGDQGKNYMKIIENTKLLARIRDFLTY